MCDNSTRVYTKKKYGTIYRFDLYRNRMNDLSHKLRSTFVLRYIDLILYKFQNFVVIPMY